MTSSIQLRPGVTFRDGNLEFPKGRRVANVRHQGTITGWTDGGAVAVAVLSAIVPTSPDKIARREHLPALAVAAIETHYLKTDRAILNALFSLSLFVEGGADFDPLRTLVLTMHGETDDVPHEAGRPALPSADAKQSIFLDPHAVAELVSGVRDPAGRRANVVVNTGCFSSTQHAKGGATFNEELAALVGEAAVFGPPHAGVVTTAHTFQEWKNQFGQLVDDQATLREASIRFQRIAPAHHKSKEGKARVQHAACSGAVIVTNDYALASELASYSADFAEDKPHQIDRALME